MVVHLITNASVLNSEAMFQKNVHLIHSLGRILPLIEWVFIFIPILFHAVFGFVIIKGGSPNHSHYPNRSNVRYSLQRASGVIAFFFIMWHVFHMHGWFHFGPWLEMAQGLNGANFRPYNASSSLNLALAGVLMPTIYLIGVGSCVFHLANGIWTMGITWGVWTSPKAQARASWICTIAGIGLMAVSISALVGAKNVDLDKALVGEQHAIEQRLYTGEITEADVHHKSYTQDELAKVKDAAKAQRKPNDADTSGNVADSDPSATIETSHD
jgi:succinate dehydrogenase / fumarate reductase cytochrome b subunit